MASAENLAIEPADVRPYTPDWAALASAATEDPFIDAGVELLKSAGTIATYTAAIVQEPPFDRDPAIRCGLLTRACKLAVALVRDACRDDGVMQLSLSRQFIETLANLLYLCDDTDGSRHQAFVLDSLLSEREFLENIRRRIARDGDGAWNIEERIRRSIDATAAAAGVVVEDIPARRSIGWPNAQQRIELVYGPTAYPAYRVGSDALHGGWTDLYRNHLRATKGGFTAEFDASRVRPQALLTSAVQLADAGSAYLDRLLQDEPDFLRPALDTLRSHTTRANQLHEQWLGR